MERDRSCRSCHETQAFMQQLYCICCKGRQHLQPWLASSADLIRAEEGLQAGDCEIQHMAHALCGSGRCRQHKNSIYLAECERHAEQLQGQKERQTEGVRRACAYLSADDMLDDCKGRRGGRPVLKGKGWGTLPQQHPQACLSGSSSC